MLYGADVVSVFHHSRIVIAEAFRAGRLPVWDPHVMAGFPMLAEPQNAIFYPPAWFCIVLSAENFWTLSAWAHLILAGVFAHLWLERGLRLGTWSALSGALVFMLSGYLSGRVFAGHVNYVWAYPWIPAVLWRLERFLAGPSLRRGVLLSIVLALLFLAGVPQFVHIVGILILLRLAHFVLLRRDGRRPRTIQAGQSLAWLALGLAWCAPQLFVTLELVGEMQRGEGTSMSSFGDVTLPPRQIGELVFGFVRTIPSMSDWWETCGFVGGAVVLLSLAVHAGKQPQRHFWSGIALLGVLLALGSSGLIYPVFAAVVPGAGWFRVPGRYLLFFTLAMAALAAIGFDTLWNRGHWGFRLLAAGLALAAAGQLIDFGLYSFKGERKARLKLEPAAVEALRRHCGLEGRVAFNTPSVQWIGPCQAAGLDQVCGYEPMMLRRYAEAINAARGAAPDAGMVIVGSVGDHAVVRMLATSVAVQHWQIHPQPDPMPRSWVVNNAVVIEDKSDRLRTIGTGKWDPRKTVILESCPADTPPVPTEKAAGKARVISKSSGRYEIEAENDADAYLVLSEAFYPGWTAEVDGKAVEVLPANHLIQTVRLPAGKHFVRFQYRSRFLAPGFAVAILAALVPIGLLVRRHRRQLPLERLPGAP